MLFKHPYLILLIITLIGCKVSEAYQYKMNEVSVTCPAGWKVTDEVNYGGYGCSLTMEKRGADQSGFKTFFWQDADLNDESLDESINQFKQSYENNFLLKNSKLNFQAALDGSYNGIPARSVQFTMSLLAVKHSGSFVAFEHKDKRFVVTIQGADEDLEINKHGFDEIEKSFKVIESF